MKVVIAWCDSAQEGFATKDLGDARYATGRGPASFGAGVSTISDTFRDVYGHRPVRLVEVEIPDPPAQAAQQEG